MKRGKSLSISVLIIFSIFISGCRADEIVEPTNTPAPSQTPSPTFTLTPTIEPPSELTTLFEEVHISYFEDFDSLPVKQWEDLKDCLEFKNGILETECMDYNGEIPLNTGEGILLDFYHTDADEFYAEIGLFNGNPYFQSDKYKAFSFASVNFPEHGDYYQYLNYQDRLKEVHSQNFEHDIIKPDIWFRLVLAIGNDGSTIVSLWERDTPNPQMNTFKQTKIEGWADSEWRLSIASEGVSLVLDNYYQFGFSDIK